MDYIVLITCLVKNHWKESRTDIFLYRHEDRPYHIDYAYAAPQNQLNFKMLNQDIFLKYSDHLPIMLEIKD